MRFRPAAVPVVAAVLAVLAMLLAAPSRAVPVPVAAASEARVAVSAGLAAAVPVAAAVPAAEVFGAGGGPSCAPGGPDHGGLPAVPPRAGGEHAQLPPARAAPEGVRPYGNLPVRVLVRGPDRPAPGPVELSVMRV
ncbi:hypothetical protein [Streptomyces sp. NBC_01408]|uniref:hypothetical protein n=1 Tax=Streptomyces sp. NBC_01408 TaxID=2903855 RepID=UPI002255E34D|nr:hypothetical protein [Streptomyces sp. NBC_01408]MCX4692018.1 hypothetical protein [Streptomyces sp. NBC_01408]